MSTMLPDGGQDQDVSVSVPLTSTPEDVLARIEHESTCVRREARALRRWLRRQRRREMPRHVRVAGFSVRVGAVGLAVGGPVVFVAVTVALVLGHVTAAMELYATATATAAWAGVAEAAFFRV
ncbi:hypothetical protein GCM10010317_092870 [Streptomyces mirabilis]|uniref:hypothetical protein n=1 Tax=Streptomyces mirabilis TaxID=68239 RepID=UPI00167CB040|nr:hypothetical protein [Streptomyces mirabilis]GHD76392.1 hypothetical protein GCM10010317_092870 [Streptomyces mirabilis]